MEDFDMIDIDLDDITGSQDIATQEAPPADTEPIVAPQADPTPTTQAPTAPESPATGKVFTQQELDQIIEKRLSREKATFEKQLKADPLRSGLERIATKSGMTPDALLAALERQQIEALADSEGLSYESAERLVKAETRAAEADRIIAEQQTQAQRQAAEQADFAAFVEEFPNVAPDAIPAEVWAARAAGTSLADAYRAHEAKQLRSELESLKQQLANISRAPISGGVGSHGSVQAESEDPYLRGFDSI